MIQDVLARVESRLKAVGLNATAASKQAGLSADAIRNLRRAASGEMGGRHGVTTRTIRALAPVLKTSVDYLLEGLGEPDQVATNVKSVPIISWVAAGRLGNVESVGADFEEGRIAVADLPNGDWVALRVKGHSMDRIAPEESVIIVNRDDKKLINNKYYVFFANDGEATFKRYKSDPDRYAPYSTDPNAEPIYPDLDGTRDWMVFGRVYKVITTI